MYLCMYVCIYLYFWLRWVFVATWGFFQFWRAGATLLCGAWVSHCGGFACCGAQAVGTQASVVVACRLSSCDARAQLLRGIWDLPGPGIEPVSPALAGGFLTTAPPGNSLGGNFYCERKYILLAMDNSVVTVLRVLAY